MPRGTWTRVNRSAPSATTSSWAIDSPPTKSCAQAVVWSVADDNRTLSVQLPTDCLGLSAKLFIRAVAPVGIREGEALPRIYAPVSLWAGGGVVVQADQSLSLSRVESKGGLIISPEQSSGWPIDSSMPLNLPVESLRGVRAARVSIEEQGTHNAPLAPKNTV